MDLSVVTIFSFADNKTLSQGSGVVLTEEGMVATNYHVFAGGDKLIVKQKNKIINQVQILGVDVEQDVMMIKIPPKSFPHCRIGKSGDLKIGQRVYAIGSPQGLENTFTEGIISGIRQLDENNQNFLQTTTALSPCSSGGALVNAKGELIGICTMTLSSEGQLLNFAIPVDELDKVKIKNISDKRSLDAFNYFFVGSNAFRTGNYEKAKNNFQKSIQSNPEYTVAFNNLGITYDRLQDYSNAVTNLEKAVELDPGYAIAWANLGVVYRHDKDYKNSVKAIMQAIKLKPDNAKYFYNAGLAYFSKGDFADAVIHYKKAIELEKNYFEAYNNIGVIYFNENDFEKAVENYRKAVDINPKYSTGQENLGLACLKNKQYKEGATSYRLAIKYGVNTIEAFYNLAKCYFLTGEYEEAIRYFLKVTDKDPMHAKSFYFLSLCYEKTGYQMKVNEHRLHSFAIKPNWKNATAEELYGMLVE